LSEAVLSLVHGAPRRLPGLHSTAQRAVVASGDVLSDDDVQLTLTVLYELHHAGLAGADDGWEWSPDLIAVRTALEEPFEAALRAAVLERTSVIDVPTDARAVPAALFALVEADDGPSLSKQLARSATRTQFGEFLTHRSLYHLKEADPHTWAIPRLSGRAKAGLVEIQADEYGGGRPERMHAALFATAMRGAGLDASYGTQVDHLPAVTLAWANAFLLLGLQRRLRGAVAGHLAALEMTSSIPNRRYARGVRRLGFPEETAWFFDEHVEADAVHEQIAAYDLAGALAADEPALVPDIVFGAAVALETDSRVAIHLLSSWAHGRSSLLDSPGGAGRSPGRATGSDG
jgi:hypothetical protein